MARASDEMIVPGVTIDHTGEHYNVAGPLNLPRTPQGRPVLVQAGSSEVGRRFAARHAEAVFTAHQQKSRSPRVNRHARRSFGSAGASSVRRLPMNRIVHRPRS